MLHHRALPLLLVACQAPATVPDENRASELRRAFVDVRALAQATGLDVTAAAQVGLDRIRSAGGGTLFFAGIFDLHDTLRIPSNTVVAGLSSGPAGTNQLRLLTPDRALFEIDPGARQVVIRDLELRALVHGAENWNGFPGMVGALERDLTTAIRLHGEGTRQITIKNVRMSLFTRGIEVVDRPDVSAESGPSEVRLRDVAADRNNAALLLDAPGATTWDVQNLDIINLTADVGDDAAPLRQRGVVLLRAGDMSFLELSCASTAHDGGTCLDVFEHGRLYFRGLFSEGPLETARVHESKESSEAPIIFQHSALGNGLFVEDDANITSVASFYCAADCPAWQGQPSLFSGAGADAHVQSCGDLAGRPDRWNLADFQLDPQFPGLREQPRPCAFDVGSAGRDEFLSELAPTEIGEMPFGGATGQYYIEPTGDPTIDTPALQRALADIARSSYIGNGALFLGPGTFRVDSTLELRFAVTLQGTPGLTVIELDSPTVNDVDEVALLAIHTESGRPHAGIGLMDLELRAVNAGRGTSLTGIRIQGCSSDCPNLGYVQDLRIHRVSVANFSRGIFIRPEALERDGIPNRSGNPMVDSVSLRNLRLIGNAVGMEILSNNASNFNVEDLRVEEMGPGAIGVLLDGPHLVFRGLRCEGRGAEACVEAKIGGGLQLRELESTGTKNALYVHASRGYSPAPIVIGFSDLSDGVFLEGRTNLVSHDSRWPRWAPRGDTSDTPGIRVGEFRPEHPDRGGNPIPGTGSYLRFCGDSFGPDDGARPEPAPLDHPIVYCDR